MINGLGSSRKKHFRPGGGGGERQTRVPDVVPSGGGKECRGFFPSGNPKESQSGQRKREKRYRGSSKTLVDKKRI